MKSRKTRNKFEFLDKILEIYFALRLDKFESFLYSV